MRATALSAWLVVCLVGTGLDAAAAPPRIANGKVTTKAAAAAIGAEIAALAGQARDAMWVGYAVPTNAAGARACCGSGDWDGGRGCSCCRLERDGGFSIRDDEQSRGASLEGADEAAIFVRLAGGVVGRVAAYSGDCDIDAGGRDVVWLTGVKPSESIAWLGERVGASSSAELSRDHAIAAIAFHADPAADAVLERMALSGGTQKVQRSAVFWMGAARGAAGFAGLTRVLASSPDDKVREHVTFALSVSGEPAAIDTLLGVAKQDRSARVRGQALFWLAQKAGAKVADTITRAVTEDPDTEVKKRAVFALSQLPKDEGVPRLIDVARTNRNIEVRKQAMFWLGQSKDPRALAFFEEVLTKR